MGTKNNLMAYALILKTKQGNLTTGFRQFTPERQTYESPNIA